MIITCSSNNSIKDTLTIDDGFMGGVWFEQKSPSQDIGMEMLVSDQDVEKLIAFLQDILNRRKSNDSLYQ